MGEDAREARAQARLRVHSDGMRSRALDSARSRRTSRALTYSGANPADQRSGDRYYQYAFAERLSGYARYIERGLPQRDLLQAHRQFGLFFGHHRRPNRGQEAGP